MTIPLALSESTIDLVFVKQVGLPIGGVASTSKTPTLIELLVVLHLIVDRINIPNMGRRINF